MRLIEVYELALEWGLVVVMEVYDKPALRVGLRHFAARCGAHPSASAFRFPPLNEEDCFAGDFCDVSQGIEQRGMIQVRWRGLCFNIERNLLPQTRGESKDL
jgi:hypothetical protein